MSLTSATTSAPDASTRRAPKQRRSWAWLGVVPFFAFLVIFLIAPALSVFQKALFDSDGNFGVDALKNAFTGQNRAAFVFSVKLSALSAFVGVVVGGLLAYAASTLRRPRWLRTFISSFSGVAANLGGVPLAFAFLALLGRQGLLTRIINDGLGVDIYRSGFALDSTAGFVFVYSYFNIPLMVLITLPAVDGLKDSWREACANLGGTSWTFWRRVGLPVLTPALLGGFLLLFANSFSAFATAAALTTKSTLVPLRIGFYLGGDFSSTGEQQLGYSLAAWMMIIMVVNMGIYYVLRRRSERWQQ